jgi:hypothetical protein
MGGPGKGGVGWGGGGDTFHVSSVMFYLPQRRHLPIALQVPTMQDLMPLIMPEKHDPVVR